MREIIGREEEVEAPGLNVFVKYSVVLVVPARVLVRMWVEKTLIASFAPIVRSHVLARAS